MKPLILGALLTLASLPATSGWFGPSDFNECLLENMKGVSSNSAALAIATACRAQFPLPHPKPPTAEEQAKAEEHQREREQARERRAKAQKAIDEAEDQECLRKNAANPYAADALCEYQRMRRASRAGLGN